MSTVGRALVASVVTCAVSTTAPATSAAQVPIPTDTIAACPTCIGSRVPVLLVHGTNTTVERSLGAVRQALIADGQCVYGLDYDSTRHIAESVDDVVSTVDAILAVNGVESIDLVGKSQGGLIVRAASLKLAQRAKNPVRKVIAIAGPQHGVEIAGRTPLVARAPQLPSFTPAICDMLSGSLYLTELNSGLMTAADVHYTMIASMYDDVITPYTASFIDAPNVTNILLQDGCPDNHANHRAMSTDPRTTDLVMHALYPQRHPTIRCVAETGSE